MKKYFAVSLFVIGFILLSTQTAHAFSFGSVIKSIFGGTQSSNLGANASVPFDNSSAMPGATLNTSSALTAPSSGSVMSGTTTVHHAVDTLPLAVDLKINASDKPAAVAYGSKFTVTWTSTGTTQCSPHGNTEVIVADEPMLKVWGNATISTSGSKQLFAETGSGNGTVSPTHYLNPITIEVDCYDANYKLVKDQVVLPVTAPIKTADATVTVSKDVNDSTDHTVQVSNSSSTQGITVAMIDMSATGSTGTIKSLPITIGVDTHNSAAKISDVISTVRLYNAAGIQIDSQSVSGVSSVPCPVGSSLAGITTARCATATFTNFNNNGISISAGATSVYSIKVDAKPINGTTFPAGTYLVAEITPTNVSNAAVLTGTHFTGSTKGSKTYFYANGIQVGYFGAASNTFSNPGIFTMTIPFSVTAYGTTAYVPAYAKNVASGTVSAPTASVGKFIQYVVDNGTALQSGGTGTVVYAGNDSLTVSSNGNYQIPVGQTKNFNLVITYSPTTTGSYRAQLANVNYNTTDSATVYNSYSAGLNTNLFHTPYVAGQGNGPVSSGCTVNSVPSVNVGSPNGGETYQPGQQITVIWGTCNYPTSSPVLIGLSSSLLNETDVIKDAIPNSGQTTITIPTTMGQGAANIASGKYYKIAIELGGNPNLQDTSDDTFTIASGSIGLPAGCTSTIGYSPITGQPCSHNPTDPLPGGDTSQLVAFPSAANQHPDAGCKGSRFSSTTGAICDGTESDFSSAFTTDSTPRIMMWPSKVNQHVDAKGIWQTDPDGTSGAQIDMLAYCKKWYPATVSLKAYKSETISTWHEANNVNNWRNTVMSYQCVQGGLML